MAWISLMLLGAAAATEPDLEIAERLVLEVERSPSANLDELRGKLSEARRHAQGALQRDAENEKVRALTKRIDDMLWSLRPPPRRDDPVLSEADAVADRLAALVKGTGACAEIRSLSARLLDLAARLAGDYPEAGEDYRRRTRELERLAPTECGADDK